jgi:hypothetical protein
MSKDEVEALAGRLFDELGAYVNMFIEANARGNDLTDVVIGALVDHLGPVIGKIQCEHCRGAVLKGVIENLVQEANADVMVTVHDDPDEVMQLALNAMKPAGSA